MKSIMKLNNYKIISILSLVLIISCTDLEIEESDSVISDSDSEFTGVDDVDAFLDDLYNGSNGATLKTIIESQENLYALNEVTTDELLVPTRGTDWGDNGIWRKLHEHTWDPLHDYVLNNWNNLNQLVFNTTLAIDTRSGGTPVQVARAKFLRAWAMFWIMDMYGQAPFREPDDGPDVNPSVLSRSEAFDFILEDLNTALPDLPDGTPGSATNDANKAAAQFLLAKMYLNKHIYLGVPTPEVSDMQQVVDLVDDITLSGFQLQSGYFEIFEPSSDSETILFTSSSVGNRMWNGLHYNQNSPDNGGGGWNGWCTLAEFYGLFEGDPDINIPGSGQEERRGYVPTDGSHLGIGYGFLIGQQYDENGDELRDRPGNPLDFTKNLPALTGNNERTGIRTIKYHPENGAFQGHQIVFRYADAYLMKAEAIFRGASSGSDPLTMINNLRNIRSASPLSSLDEQGILDERGRELYKEFWRRNDLIRFGQFAQPWEFKINNDDFRNLFPIPGTAILSNPNLSQNPGY